MEFGGMKKEEDVCVGWFAAYVTRRPDRLTKNAGGLFFTLVFFFGKRVMNWN